MVPNRPPSAASAEGNWQEHVDGKSNFAPPILPLAPAKFTGSLYVTSDTILFRSAQPSVRRWKIQPEAMCTNGGAPRRRHNLWHAGLYVLGSRVPFHQKCLHHAAQHLPRGRRYRRQDLQHSSAHAGVAATVEAKLAASLLTPHRVDAKEKDDVLILQRTVVSSLHAIWAFSQLAVAVATHRACVLSIAMAAPVVGCFWARAALFTLPIGTGVGEGWGAEVAGFERNHSAVLCRGVAARWSLLRAAHCSGRNRSRSTWSRRNPPVRRQIAACLPWCTRRSARPKAR